MLQKNGPLQRPPNHVHRVNQQTLDFCAEGITKQAEIVSNTACNKKAENNRTSICFMHNQLNHSIRLQELDLRYLRVQAMTRRAVRINNKTRRQTITREPTTLLTLFV